MPRPETLVTHLVWKFRGEMTLKGVGKNPYLAGAAAHTDAQLRSLQKQADANKIIYYSFTNGSDIKVKDNGKETHAVNLTFVTTQDTSAMFLAQVLLTAEPDTEVVKLPVTGDTASDFGGTATPEQDAALTLTVRYYLDNVLIDSFTPAQRLVRGAHALALFYPFPDLEGAASHRWSVRLLCAGGGVKIGKGRSVLPSPARAWRWATPGTARWSLRSWVGPPDPDACGPQGAGHSGRHPGRHAEAHR